MLAAPNKVFNVILRDLLGVVWQIWLNREQNDSLSFIILETRTAKLVIRFEVRSFLRLCYFLKCSYLAIPAKLHCPKGDRINESLVVLANDWPHPVKSDIPVKLSYKLPSAILGLLRVSMLVVTTYR